jgi:Transposase IS4
MTKYEFDDRRDLWSDTAGSNYKHMPKFGTLTGMVRDCFDFLFSMIRWSFQSAELLEGMTSKKYRWMLLDNFVHEFNEHHRDFFIATDRICVDESFSWWYGHGGAWINIGSPCYISFERKPEDGCEIWTACDGRTGVMLQLKICKSARQQKEDKEEEDVTDDERVEDGLNHGTEVLMTLVRPWYGSKQLVVADSFFSSVQTAMKLKAKDLYYIGVVKTATNEFPMKFLNQVILRKKGDQYGLVSKDHCGHPELLSFVWRDQDRCYFICSGGSMAEGTPHVRQCMRQVIKDDTSST